MGQFDWQTSGLEKAQTGAHICSMANKRGGIADGVKTAYHVHPALEAAQNLMAATLVAVIGGLW